MEQKQRVIFDLPEDASVAEIIIKIMETNNVPDAYDFTHIIGKGSKFITISDCAKDLFDKKITEEEGVKLFQEKLGVSKENATGIVSDIKKNLIPFAKKVQIETAESKQSSPATNDEENPISFVKQRPNISVEENEKLLNRKKKPIAAEETDKLPKKIVPPTKTKSSGPDKYREPVE